VIVRVRLRCQLGGRDYQCDTRGGCRDRLGQGGYFVGVGRRVEMPETRQGGGVERGGEREEVLVAELPVGEDEKR
jgi:hypothetical protein